MAVELIGSPVIRALLNKLTPLVSDEIYRVWGVKDEMEQLQKTLEAIQAVLTDAEKQQVDRQSIKLWLRDLKDIAYDAEDILDEYAYESLRKGIETRKRKRMQRFFSSSNSIALGIKMGKKLKNLNRKLIRIEVSKNMFHLSENILNLSISDTNVSNIGQSSRETSSYINPSEIIGRELAASDVIKLLINSSNNQENYSIIRIVGMGGIGKTALAQIVYRNATVERQFKPKLWVCISQRSNKKRIFIQLLESLLHRKFDESLSLDVIESHLRKWLQNKRYLIVLDDMWNDRGNQWNEMLKTLLDVGGAQGSKVIVTTRSNEVIASMGSSLYSIIATIWLDCLRKIAGFCLRKLHLGLKEYKSRQT